MRRAMSFIAAAALAGALPHAAAEEPEDAYAKFHRAAAAADVAEMMRHASAAQRTELERTSPAQRQAQAKILAAMTPGSFELRQKIPEPGGQAATLIVTGPSRNIVNGRPELLYGTIRMAIEGGTWRVLESRWSTEQPGIVAPVRAAPASAPEKAALPARPPPRGSPPVVGSMDAAPERKLGTQKPGCVYKPVMTAEDLENCR